jgi:exodeoxyribonuclease VII large subunit
MRGLGNEGGLTGRGECGWWVVMSDGEQAVMSVSELTRGIRMLLEEQIGSVWVEGEVSNLRRQASGHQYFTLKDEGAQLSCVLFRGNAARSAVRLADGVAVRLLGEISVYEARGNYQMIVRQVEAQGQGSLQARFEALKARLHAEGLFDAEAKQAIPKFPRVVALVTSPTGAAIRDMINVLGRRAPWLRVLVYPVRVQGAGAEREIAEAVGALNDWERLGIPRPDTIVVGRGGGSLEDLWNFNEEVVARAIYRSEIPVISAVGHEIDFTIADFVADLRAPTPSAAAELLAPDVAELKRHFEALKRRMGSRVETVLDRQAQLLTMARKGALAHEPQRRLMAAEQAVDDREAGLREAVRAWLERENERCRDRGLRLERLHPVRQLGEVEHRLVLAAQRLRQGMRHRMEAVAETIKSKEESLRLLGPQSVLSRGFSYTLSAEGKVIRSAEDVREGEVILTHLERGVLRSVVKGG